MNKSRLEAFSDGVFAIIITIMVLELKVPHGDQLSDLKPVLPRFLSYILSFAYVGIYWNNHHHMVYMVERIKGMVLWANLNLLFWLSLVPFVTDWMGENKFTEWPVALYGIILLLSAIAFVILERLLIKDAGKEALITRALNNDWKGKVSIAMYLLSIGLAFVNTTISMVMFAVVAMLWFIPDTRVERLLIPEENKC